MIHNITNYVTVNDVANVILACGGSPIMSDEAEDVEDITSLCGGLNINIGTLHKTSIEGIFRAGRRANELGHPIVLDPVGAGASEFRTDTALSLMKNLRLSAVRGNISEIRTLAGDRGNTKGVDADIADAVTEDTLDEAVAFVKTFSRKAGCIIAVTGAVDLVSDGISCFVIRNGRPEMGKITGEMLNKTGIHMNFAHVLDIEHYEENTSIGNRAYGKDKNTVISMGIPVMKALQKENIIAVAKHFPGHGLSKVDSHFFIPRITEKEEVLRNEELKPFAIAIQEGADAIMLGHLLIEAWDAKTPASLSEHIVTNILKNELNFEGLIITDDLKMLAIRLMYSMEEAVSKAIIAGNDSIILGLETNKILSIIEKVEKRIFRGIIPLEKVDKSVNKIIQMKKKYKIGNEPAKRNQYTKYK